VFVRKILDASMNSCRKLEIDFKAYFKIKIKIYDFITMKSMKDMKFKPVPVS
jgi:hypothetical protein